MWYANTQSQFECRLRSVRSSVNMRRHTDPTVAVSSNGTTFDFHKIAIKIKKSIAREKELQQMNHHEHLIVRDNGSVAFLSLLHVRDSCS